MSDRTFVMTREPNLEDLLRDEIMESVMRSARVTPEDLRQLAVLAQQARAGKCRSEHSDA
jgi:hypothetical protein